MPRGGAVGPSGRPWGRPLMCRPAEPARVEGCRPLTGQGLDKRPHDVGQQGLKTFWFGFDEVVELAARIPAEVIDRLKGYFPVPALKHVHGVADQGFRHLRRPKRHPFPTMRKIHT